MLIRKSIAAKIPTVQWGNIEISTEIEMDSRDYGQTSPEQLGQAATLLVQQQWVQLRDEVERNLIEKVVSILPPELERQLIMKGKIKP